jgi:hypothetical protein
VRENKLKASMMQAKRSNAEFIDLVEKGKQQKYVESRKRKQDTADDGKTSNETKKSNPLDESRVAQKGVKRVFRQSSGLSSSGSQYVDKNLLGSVFKAR